MVIEEENSKMKKLRKYRSKLLDVEESHLCKKVTLLGLRKVKITSLSIDSFMQERHKIPFVRSNTSKG